MRVLVDRRNKKFFSGILILMLIFMAGIVILSCIQPENTVLYEVGLGIIITGLLLFILYSFLKEDDWIMEQAASILDEFESGKHDVRLSSDGEGERYRLFHEINKLMEIMKADIETEAQAKTFLKDTISDISHQLKTPLAALQIYNDILHDETADAETLRRFTDLSEQELDRISTLVGSLLKIAKLDAGTSPVDKKDESISDIMNDIQRAFAYRADQEQKRLSFAGDDSISLFCDRIWITEAISNIVKNALDHTEPGDRIMVGWRKLPQVVQITVEDSGSGIHPEDLHHIFKRFYRSRYSQDTQGIGLGLPLAKAIIEAHEGTVEVRSEFGEGTAFTINLLIPTKLQD